MSADSKRISRPLFFSLFVVAFVFILLSLFPRCAHGKSLAVIIPVNTVEIVCVLQIGTSVAGGTLAAVGTGLLVIRF